jgi:hypothetical protein
MTTSLWRITKTASKWPGGVLRHMQCTTASPFLKGCKPMLEIEKVPELLELVAPISAILGPSWKFDTDKWEEAEHVSWYPESAPHDHPVAVDFHTMAGEGPCVVQLLDIRGQADDISPEIREKVNAVIAYCKSNQIPYGFEQG